MKRRTLIIALIISSVSVFLINLILPFSLWLLIPNLISVVIVTAIFISVYLGTRVSRQFKILLLLILFMHASMIDNFSKELILNYRLSPNVRIAVLGGLISLIGVSLVVVKRNVDIKKHVDG